MGELRDMIDVAAEVTNATLLERIAGYEERIASLERINENQERIINAFIKTINFVLENA
jgi:hypothetical protein